MDNLYRYCATMMWKGFPINAYIVYAHNIDAARQEGQKIFECVKNQGYDSFSVHREKAGNSVCMKVRKKPTFTYNVGIGYAGISLKHYTVEAENIEEARHKAHEFLNPEKGYDHIEVRRMKKNG